MIVIDTKKRVDWNAIRAEYISGGISQRKLAEKHGITYPVLRNKAEIENWVGLRETAKRKTNARVTQKVAEAAADNATIAANIKRKALIILEGLLDEYVGMRSTEHRENKQGVTDVFRFRDLTAAYKDLTGDIVQGQNDNALLQALMELERSRT